MSFAQKLKEVFIPPKDDQEPVANQPQPEAEAEEPPVKGMPSQASAAHRSSECHYRRLERRI